MSVMDILKQTPYLPGHETTGKTKWYETRRRPLRLGVMHVTTSLPDFKPPDVGAENAVKYGATTDRQVSWHFTVDSDSIIYTLPIAWTGFHVRDYNSISVGLEIATTTNWVNTPLDWRLKVLENVAQVMALMKHVAGIPLVFIGRAQVDAGNAGWTSHSELDPTRRTDPGVSFPWSHVIKRAEEIYTAEFGQPWYAQYVQKALDRGIISPAPDLRIDAPATRAEVIAMVVRATEFHWDRTI